MPLPAGATTAREAFAAPGSNRSNSTGGPARRSIPTRMPEPPASPTTNGQRAGQAAGVQGQRRPARRPPPRGARRGSPGAAGRPAPGCPPPAGTTAVCTRACSPSRAVPRAARVGARRRRYTATSNRRSWRRARASRSRARSSTATCTSGSGVAPSCAARLRTACSRACRFSRARRTRASSLGATWTRQVDRRVQRHQGREPRLQERPGVGRQGQRAGGLAGAGAVLQHDGVLVGPHRGRGQPAGQRLRGRPAGPAPRDRPGRRPPRPPAAPGAGARGTSARTRSRPAGPAAPVTPPGRGAPAPSRKRPASTASRAADAAQQVVRAGPLGRGAVDPPRRGGPGLPRPPARRLQGDQAVRGQPLRRHPQAGQALGQVVAARGELRPRLGPREARIGRHDAEAPAPQQAPLPAQGGGEVGVGPAQAGQARRRLVPHPPAHLGGVLGEGHLLRPHEQLHRVRQRPEQRPGGGQHVELLGRRQRGHRPPRHLQDGHAPPVPQHQHVPPGRQRPDVPLLGAPDPPPAGPPQPASLRSVRPRQLLLPLAAAARADRRRRPRPRPGAAAGSPRPAATPPAGATGRGAPRRARTGGASPRPASRWPATARAARASATTSELPDQGVRRRRDAPAAGGRIGASTTPASPAAASGGSARATSRPRVASGTSHASPQARTASTPGSSTRRSSSCSRVGHSPTRAAAASRSASSLATAARSALQPRPAADGLRRWPGRPGPGPGRWRPARASPGRPAPAWGSPRRWPTGTRPRPPSPP